MRRSAVLLMTAVSLCTPSPLLAQDGKLTISAAAIAVGPLSGSARQFTTGFGVDLGITWHFTDQLGVRVDFVQAALGAKDNPQFPALIPLDREPRESVAPTRVSSRMKFGTVNVVFRAPVEKVRLYVTAGAGVYHRSVDLTVSTPGLVSVCNPWWFVCFPGLVTAGQANATRSTTNLGVNVGAGITVGRFFAETRYHYIWGPTFSMPAGGSVPATGKFLPLVVGMRF